MGQTTTPKRKLAFLAREKIIKRSQSAVLTLLDSLNLAGYRHGEFNRLGGAMCAHSPTRRKSAKHPARSLKKMGRMAYTSIQNLNLLLGRDDEESRINHVAWRFFGNVKLTGSFPDVDVEENSGPARPAGITVL